MKTRHSYRGRTESWLFSGSHLTDEALLRSLDGELSPRESADVDAHVQSCWSCRSRRQAIGHSIADLVEYQNAVTAPYLPPPGEQRAVFLLRLNTLASEAGHPSPLKKWFNRVIRSLSFDPANRSVRIAGVLVLLACIVIVRFARTPRIVSADELLSRAEASEATSLKSAVEPVIVQKLRIRVGKRSVTRTVYRDVAHHQTASHTDASAMEEEQVRAEYLRSSLDWNSPLDAETYTRWRASRAAGSGRVMRAGDDRLMLETTYSTGLISESELTVRLADYHVIKESFRLQDNSEIEVAELSYNVVPFASLSAGIFGRPTPLPVVRSPIVVMPRPVLPGRAELAAAEVQAEVVLHELGADLGEQIKISDPVEHAVLIDGVVEGEARRQQLVSALQNIPLTRLHIVTIDEAANDAVQQAPSLSSASDSGHSAAVSVQTLVASPPLLDGQLNTRFPDKDQRIAYVNQTLSLAQQASARAWALNRLADRHSSQDLAVLGNEERHQLQVLLVDHISALREDISSLQNQLGEILSRSSNTPAANTSVKTTLDAGSVGTPGSSEDWRGRIRRIHSSTESIHEAVVALLSSSQPGDQNNGNAIEVDLRTSLTQLQTELQVLDQRAHEGDLK
jgi:hypothetical protein